MQRTGLVLAALILPCCAGITAIGATAGDDAGTRTAGGAGRPVAGQRAATTAPRAGTPAGAATPVPSAPATAAPTTPAPTTPATTRRTVTTTATIPYRTERVDDDSLAEGRTRVRTRGVTGVRTLTYELTFVGGRQTGRRLVRTVVTRRPVTKVIAVGTRAEPAGGCDSNYTPCVPVASDVDCAGGSGNGPAYVDGPVRVTGTDVYDLDRDGDGVACDS